MAWSRAEAEVHRAGHGRLVRFAAGASHAPAGDAASELRGPHWSYQVTDLPAEFRTCLAHLPMESATFWDAARSAGAASLAVAEALGQLRAIEEVVVDERGDPVVLVQRPRPPAPAPAAGDRCCRLTKDAYLRFGSDESLLMSVSSSAVVHVPTRHLALFVAAILSGGEDHPLLSTVRELLLDNGLFVVGDDPSAAPWSFPDRLFHTVATYGRGYEGGYGATWAGLRASRTAAVAAGSAGFAAGKTIELPIDNEPLHADFGTVLAGRRSCRAYSERQLSPEQLAPLLQRALHTQRATVSSDGLRVAFHPYPSGGACDEITTLVAFRGDGADPSTASLALYSNHEHCLEILPSSAEKALLVLRSFAAACELGALPGAALVFVADYGRMALKYEAIAYATILRNVGAIYQTVYLVAEALGLGTCAVGGGWGEIEHGVVSALLPGRVVGGGILVGWPTNGD